jgi:septum formation protein
VVTTADSDSQSQSPKPPLILASASPRRSTLLERAGVRFEVRPADIPEERREDEPAVAFVERMACEKALAVAKRVSEDDERWVLGADTVVVLGDKVLGKPRDHAHAIEMLAELAGREHRVVTGVAVVSSADATRHCLSVETLVEMRPLLRAEIEEYVASREPLDKAGAYALQGEGRNLVFRVSGSETNVIGLPMEETLELLGRIGLEETFHL